MPFRRPQVFVTVVLDTSEAFVAKWSSKLKVLWGEHLYMGRYELINLGWKRSGLSAHYPSNTGGCNRSGERDMLGGIALAESLRRERSRLVYHNMNQ